MLFSIIVPIYNVGPHLPSCLESISSQSFRDFEVVLVNDGSTDNSLALCEEYQRTSENPVLIVDQENSGLLLARRAGIEAANGDYIISLDGDDGLRGDALEIISNILDASNADVICFGFSRSKDFSSNMPLPLAENRIYSASETRRLFCANNKMNSMWSKAIRSNCVGKDVDFRTYGRLNLGEDAIQSALVYDRIRSLAYIDMPLYYYRQNTQSISTNLGWSYLDDVERVHECLYEWAESWQTIDNDNEYLDLLIARCMEEIVHFLLHFEEESRGDLANAINSVRHTKAVRSYSSGYGERSIKRRHTRIISKLLINGNNKALQVLLQAYRKLGV